MKKLTVLVVSWALLFAVPAIASAQWVRTNGPKVTVQAFGVVSKNLFAGTNNGVFLTTNYGTSWTQVNSGLADTGVAALAAIGTNLFAGTASGVFLTTNNGTSWRQVNNGLTDTTINKLTVVGTNLFAAANGGGIFVSTNNGTSWTTADGSIFQNAYVALLSGAGSSLFASSVSNNIIYRSTDNGTSWALADSGLFGANAIVQCGSNFIAGGVPGLFVSTNNAVSWNQDTLYVFGNFPQISGFATRGSIVYGVAYNAVVAGANNGTSWSDITSSLSLNDPYTAIAIIDTNLFIGTNNNSDFTKVATVWRLSLNTLATGVNRAENGAPTTFSLDQNYPNPFNPTTTISYRLPSAGRVTLKVYDALGRQVATLVDGVEHAGGHAVTFDASRLSSGIYFYRIQAGSSSQTRKLMLVK